MKNKIKEFFKNNKIYTILFFSLLIINLLISTTTYEYTEFSLQLPFKTLYGTISWGILILFGIIYYFIFREKTHKKIKLETLYIIVAIPIGILYCLVNPLGRVPDEVYHARKALAISQGNIFSHADENGKATEIVDSKIPVILIHIKKLLNIFMKKLESLLKLNITLWHYILQFVMHHKQ